VRRWLEGPAAVRTEIGQAISRERGLIKLAVEGGRIDVADAYNAYATALRPGDRNEVIAELARLWHSVKHQAVPDGDLTFIFESYADDIGHYPLDVIVGAIATARRGASGWWPPVTDLLDSCAVRCASRLYRHRILGIALDAADGSPGRGAT